MLRLTVQRQGHPDTESTFVGDVVTIGRSPENQLVLDEDSVSTFHGRLEQRGRQLVYTDLGSTNGTILHHDGRALAITGRQVRGQLVFEEDRIRIGPFSLRVESNDPRIGRRETQVLETQALRTAALVGSGTLSGVDPRQADQILAMLADGHATLGSMPRLCSCLRDHLFRLFPKATHFSIVLRDAQGLSLVVAFHEGRKGDTAEVRISHTIVHRVMRDEVAVLLVDGGARELESAPSLVLSRIETAICAPLRNTVGTFGAIQLDVRETRGQLLDGADLSLLVAVADFVAGLVDAQRQLQAGQNGLLAALDSLLREREAIAHGAVVRARRIRTLAVSIGRTMRLSARDLELLNASASLLAWPRARTPNLFYPDALHDAPFIASCRDERLDGSGPHGLTAELISLPVRILGLAAHVVDQAGTVTAGALWEGLERDRGILWDPSCLDALRTLFGAMDRSLGTQSEAEEHAA